MREAETIAASFRLMRSAAISPRVRFSPQDRTWQYVIFFRGEATTCRKTHSSDIDSPTAEFAGTSSATYIVHKWNNLNLEIEESVADRDLLQWPQWSLKRVASARMQLSSDVSSLSNPQCRPTFNARCWRPSASRLDAQTINMSLLAAV